MRKIIETICILICLAVVAFSVWKLYGYYRSYQSGKEEYDNLTSYIDKNESVDGTGSEEDPEKESGKSRCPVTVDFDALKKINPDVVGWLHIPDTGIDYPIVQTSDNTTYLHKTFCGENSHVGAIFLDALCQPDFSSFNSILYGHNLKNGEMFGQLKKLYDLEYNSEADYKEHPRIWIITPDDAYEYEIFAFREIDVEKDSDVYTVELSDLEDRRDYLDDQIRKSQKETEIRPSEGGRILTLSTCTSRTEDGRFLVQAAQK